MRIQILQSLLLFSLLAGLPFAWILRDGLGSDAQESQGWQAIWRTFMNFFIGPTLMLLGGIYALLRRRQNARNGHS
ncbi:MAG: hypothetical protein H8E15_13725 [Planctomycetes bacterium]|nr:hypothetical protein [Planctomycetota bacterium]